MIAEDGEQLRMFDHTRPPHALFDPDRPYSHFDSNWMYCMNDITHPDMMAKHSVCVKCLDHLKENQ